ncbi:MAG: hypothetical protein OEY11_01590 [Gammaproteobacteria bacterium]|nr:hypothetical protein [Gammaproteobacteria bacterium]
MTIMNEINHEQLCIYTNCSGKMCIKDFDDYFSRVWTVSSHFGYNELFDTTQGDWSEFDFSYLFNIAKMASQLTAIDPRSKLAWVLPNSKFKKLTDFYVSSKNMITTESRQLEAFFDQQQALDWLGVINQPCYYADKI